MIKPCGHRVLIKPQETETQTPAGIIIPDSVKESRDQAQIFGELVAIGETAWKAFDDGVAWAKLGDTVTIAKYGGFIIEDPQTGEKFRLLNDEDICAVITEN